MAHSFDVVDTAGTHACSCQSNGLARTIIKCIVKLTSVLLNPYIFIILIYFSIKTNGSKKIQDLVARMSISQHILV